MLFLSSTSLFLRGELGLPELTRRSFWEKPPEILVFGFLSIIFGILLAIAGVVIGSEPTFNAVGANTWPFVAWAGVGIAVSGIGFVMGKRWGYVGSFLLYAATYFTSILQAFQRDFVWGIFLDLLILIFLLVPRVRSFFFSPAQSEGFSQPVTTIPESLVAMQSLASRVSRILSKPSNVVTGIVMLGLILIVPVVAVSVHTVSVTEVRLNIIYPANSDLNLWFGFSQQTVGRNMFTWGNGKMALSFSLTNLGLFRQHSIDSFTLLTPGFTLYSTGTPVTLPDMATITFHMVLQAPDYDYNGQVLLEMHTI